MTLRITKRFEFSASHQLSGLAEGHQCSRLHGHNYVVELELSAKKADLTPTGFVRDYGDLAAFKQWIDKTVDHRHLNDIVKGNPTAEQLAMWLYDQWSGDLPELTAVSVSETPKTWAEYRPAPAS
ncbi:6-pyruvoyl trahydropterin synthase family protein [Streptomyces sp. NPDC090052]|uniref:6-pyruvoyl trahydropterin synthase family protein n=1 Tax=unclassified Streptomyces TaxID=2593676 RepID=UPI002250F8B6|nr:MULTISPECIES: 6-pyruvoyl tetrahydropterin synthase family protein [unclassified Streptomyces]MCX4728873.1 6-pyruvoyl tetrahydropterin synthase family protein [Streptomyces sp. NBC_01306]WSV08320.1 6-pyruvoyl tetrahydropterin synthase family protein [Streptomyces sp. NBC_01020]WSX65524.1 6-pyruvoyl tetrahydropterin synthase family protein [Streptomyces sp. NBC_00932]